MSRLGTRSEIEKLGETLALDGTGLGFLADLPPEELRSLRVSIYERLFEQDRLLFERLAMFATHMPAVAAARLAERTLGPLISARVVAEMAPGPALAVARKVPVAFFADAAAYLDPRRLRDLIAQLPAETVVAIAVELVGRSEFMTLSRFVDFVTDEQMQAVVEAIEDEAAILQIAFYMGSKNRMDHVFHTLSEQRIERMIQRVEERPDELLEPFLSVLIHVSYGLRRAVGDVLAGLPEAVLSGYVKAVADQDLWADVLPVLDGLSDGAMRRIVNLPILSEPDVQRGIVQSADRYRLWGTVLPLIAIMDDRTRDAVASIVATMDPQALGHISEAALMGEQWDAVLGLVARMPPAKHSELAACVAAYATADPALVKRISSRGRELGVELVQLVT